MLHSVESAINTTALAIAAELNRQAAEARMKAAAAEAQRKAELDAEASRKEAEQAAKAATEEAEKRAAEAERAAAEELRKAAEAEAKRKEAEEALVKAEADNQRKREEALRSQAAAEKASAVAPVAPGVDPNASQKKGGSGEAQAAVQSIPGNRTTPAALEQAGRYMQLLKVRAFRHFCFRVPTSPVQDIKANVRPAVKADRQLNQFCFKSRMTVTLRIGQITNSRTQVRRISNDLITLLADAGRVSPLARQWVMDFLAKQMANQAEKEVAVFKPLAFPMARVAQNVVAKSPEFCEILLGRLMKRNPYLIPNYPIRLKSESLDEYCKRLAMKKRDDEWEKEAHYEERLGGTAALFAAFMQTLPEGAPGGCLTMADAWTWLARLLNLPPRKITPQLILTFLEVAGPELLRTYRKQATKLLRFIAEKCLPQMPKESVAATTRLRLHLEGTRNKVHLPEPDGFRFSEP
ncbi:GLE1-like protein-domain-containing protein [Hyaloraphidium curvatum]|nr:GLE1-like protein-domain-containing protein [Hyaloraphidium curvatum]